MNESVRDRETVMHGLDKPKPKMDLNGSRVISMVAGYGSNKFKAVGMAEKMKGILGGLLGCYYQSHLFASLR